MRAASALQKLTIAMSTFDNQPLLNIVNCFFNGFYLVFCFKW